MIPFMSENELPIGETVVYRGDSRREVTNESKETSIKTINLLARSEPSLVASVLSDWINSRPNLPR